MKAERKFLYCLTVWLIAVMLAGGSQGKETNVECFVTGELDGDYVSVFVDKEFKMSGFVKTNRVLGLALSFVVPDNTRSHEIKITVGHDPDLETVLPFKYDPKGGTYVMIEYQGRGRLFAKQSGEPPQFR